MTSMRGGCAEIPGGAADGQVWRPEAFVRTGPWLGGGVVWAFLRGHASPRLGTKWCRWLLRAMRGLVERQPRLTGAAMLAFE